MKRNLKNIIICLILISYIFVYRFFIYTDLLKYNESITSSFSIVLFTLSLIFYGYRKNIRNIVNSKIIKNLLWNIALYFLIIYGVGIIVGFLSNSYSLTLKGILENIIPVLVTILFSELFRYIFIRANKDKKLLVVIITFLLILFELNLQVRYDSFTDVEQIFRFSSITILPIIMKNILCSYLVYQNDYRSSLIYRIIMDTYFYVVPIIPDFNDYVLSVLGLLIPFVIFIKSIKIVDDKGIAKKVKKKRKFLNLRDIPLLVIAIIIICMIMGIGPIKLIGIESPSMTPSIKKGDAVIIDKTYNKDKLKVNDIIAYIDKEDKIIVHIIININKDGTFITKGDLNNTSDKEYVKKDQIQGKVILTIPYIAYPSIVLRGE